MSRFCLILVASLVCSLSPIQVPAQEKNQEQKQEDALPAGADGKRIQKIREYLTDAGTSFKADDFARAGKAVKAAQGLMSRAIKNGTEEFRTVLEKEHGRIAKAHELLTAKKIELPDLAAFPETLGKEEMEATTDSSDSGEATEESSGGVSFKFDVAPILVKNCGSCHVTSSKGRLSLSTFEVLMSQRDGKSIVPGSSDTSLIIEVMDDGSMPKKKELDKDEIDVIRAWINEGAKFDGEDKELEKPIGSFRKDKDDR